MKHVKSICTSCNIESLVVNFDGVSFNAKETLPDGLCFLLFNSIFPYIKTLTSGGWFNWVGHDEHVVAKCPAVNGIAVHVKDPTDHKSEVLECEVMEKRGQCFRGHQLNDQFYFDVSKTNLERIEILFNLFPNIVNTTTSRQATGSMEVRLDNGKSKNLKYAVKFPTLSKEID